MIMCAQYLDGLLDIYLSKGKEKVEEYYRVDSFNSIGPYFTYLLHLSFFLIQGSLAEMCVLKARFRKYFLLLLAELTKFSISCLELALLQCLTVVIFLFAAINSLHQSCAQGRFFFLVKNVDVRYLMHPFLQHM
jgi:hypothetical protein